LSDWISNSREKKSFWFSWSLHWFLSSSQLEKQRNALAASEKKLREYDARRRGFCCCQTSDFLKAVLKS